MSLKEKLNADLKEAMKAKDQVRTSVLRMILSEMKYAQAAVNIHQELPDSEAERVVAGYHKRLAKSLEDYPEGERREAIRKEMAIVEDYLPKKAGPEAIAAAIAAAMSATTERNFGPLMKDVLARLGSGADGKAVSAMLKDKLAGK